MVRGIAILALVWLAAAGEAIGSDVLARRFIHGTSRIDERAVLIEGHLGDPNPVAGNATAEGYYYLLQELDSVPALMRQNGALGEANVYSAYGRVRTFGYPVCDINRDGVVTNADYALFGLPGTSGSPTNDPTMDYDFDGDRDYGDWYALHHYSGCDADTSDPVSCVGNPYAFTGRRLVRYESLPDDDDSQLSNEQLQFNRARWLDHATSRWLQRDPKGYADGMSLYEYCRSNPTKYADPDGTDTLTETPFSLRYQSNGLDWDFARFLGDDLVLIEASDWPLAFVLHKGDAVRMFDTSPLQSDFLSQRGMMMYATGLLTQSWSESGFVGVFDKRRGSKGWLAPSDLDDDEFVRAISRHSLDQQIGDVADLTTTAFTLTYSAFNIPAGGGASAVELGGAAVNARDGRERMSIIATGVLAVTATMAIHHFAFAERRATGVANEARTANRGVIEVLERTGRSEEAALYDSLLVGARSDVATQRRIVPALLFDNPKAGGLGYVRFDGIDPNDPLTLIDRKLNATTLPDQVDRMRRMDAALRQNPGYRLRIEVPNKIAIGNVRRLLGKANADLTRIDVVIVPWENARP